MLRYLKKEYLSIKYLTLIFMMILALVTSVLVIGFKNNGELISLYASEYSRAFNLEIFKILRYIILVTITLFFYFIENKEDVILIVTKGRAKVGLAKYFYFHFFFFIMYIVYFLIYLSISAISFKYFDISKEFLILYLKNYLSVFLFINFLFLLIKKDNKLLCVFILLIYILISQILIDYNEYLFVYKYLIPIYETGIYNHYLGYVYFGLFNFALFLMYFLKKNYESIDVN